MSKIITESKTITAGSFLSPATLEVSSAPAREIRSSAFFSFLFFFSFCRCSSKQTTNFNFNFVPLLLTLLVISLSSCTCSLAQDINTNTVIKLGYLEPDVVPAAGAHGENPTAVATGKGVTKVKSKDFGVPKKVLQLEYDCPKDEVVGFARIFSIPCKTNAECKFLGVDQRCCKRICRKGTPAAPKEPEHRAVLGVNRMCPKEPVPEILPVKNCLSDIDCEEEGRVCCPDSDLKLYCRTAAPVWSQLPFPRAHEPLMSLIGYMQCQKAPPQLLDIFSQPCNRTLDCLPNLCCQEGPNKFCRPAKKSVLSLVAQATQRFARG